VCGVECRRGRMNKKTLSERDICTKFITPALVKAGWNVQTQIREEVSLTKGKVMVSGRIHRRGEAKRADYLLHYKPNLPLAIIEAKDNNHTVGAGMQQGLGYADILKDVPFVFSSNGDGFLFHDRTVKSGPVERELTLDQFPSPDELWRRYCASKSISPEIEPVVAQDYYPSPENKTPRYYQLTAINRTIEAIAKGQNRVLLVMATGTGKTFVAFQIIWRLWKARARKRILFLADRNILVDQARTNDFKPFGAAMTKITNRQVDKSYEIYLSLYQAVAGSEEERNIYKQFSPDFFDLVVVDECHRGSAAEDSAWREILEYFSSATQIGLTATPKETRDISNIDYFGDPIFTYSLRQGIEDGFLAPFKVVRLDIDRDVLGWRPAKGQRDKHGQVIEDRIYNQRDMDRTLVLEKRTELVAQRITQFLKATDRFAKTIVFCEDIDHAERMRQALVNENADLIAQNEKYVMRITGDSPEGKAELDNFILPEERYPVVVTTSRLLNTGVDAQTCKLIVLDQRIESMTTFKQIIGRGTRINEDFGKLWFTIMDFKKATELFADPDFDGPPIQIYEPKPGESIEPPDDGGILVDPPPEPPTSGVKYVVNQVEVMVLRERVQYFDKDGKPITESLKDYTRKAVRQNFASLDAFLDHWGSAEQKRLLVEEFVGRGIFLEALAEEVGLAYDPFDLVCHVAYDQPPLTRKERAANVRKRNYFSKYGEQARAVLNALLDKYADEGLEPVESVDVLKVQPFNRLGTPVELVRSFGGREKYLQAVRELEKELYKG
jgi:type I restriction enzyme R subunit